MGFGFRPFEMRKASAAKSQLPRAGKKNAAEAAWRKYTNLACREGGKAPDAGEGKLRYVVGSLAVLLLEAFHLVFETQLELLQPHLFNFFVFG